MQNGARRRLRVRGLADADERRRRGHCQWHGKVLNTTHVDPFQAVSVFETTQVATTPEVVILAIGSRKNRHVAYLRIGLIRD